jgi:ubiquinone/menaquinone biosynthesis C-methylase UbiE
MSLIGTLHNSLVLGRRKRVLAQRIADIIPDKAISVLDVGSGDGGVDFLVQQLRPTLTVTGVDVLIRPQTKIPVEIFDGKRLPFASGAFDIVMFIDVLHHTNDSLTLLTEAARVAKIGVVIKDHTREGMFAYETLRLMDWVGNAHHGVALPYNYLNFNQWLSTFSSAGLARVSWNSTLNLYPIPLSWVFERRLHFICLLEQLR